MAKSTKPKEKSTSKKKAKSSVEEKPIEIQVHIERENPHELFPLHVNDFTVSHHEDLFYFTFSQYEIPPIQGAAEAKKLKSVSAVATAKLVLSAEFTERVVEALQDNLKKYTARKETNG